MIDIEGLEPTQAEIKQLCDPRVTGLILFTRNYASPAQLERLCATLHALPRPHGPLLIAVDHEGGRVQRFREGFSLIPAMASLGELFVTVPEQALQAAEGLAYVLAAELRVHGVDFSFAPVLDLDWGRSGVIGNRAFSADPEVVAALAGAFIRGMRAAGMACCGKHFPGHGWVVADSHVDIPVDNRDLAALARDLRPYQALIAAGQLDAVMPAHVIYPEIDAQPAGFSARWLNKLRQEMGFSGVIFSDDLSMAGAHVAGDIIARCQAAWSAGCDMLLICNAPDAVRDVLAHWHPVADANRSERIRRLLPQQPLSIAHIEQAELWQVGQAALAHWKNA